MHLGQGAYPWPRIGSPLEMHQWMGLEKFKVLFKKAL